MSLRLWVLIAVAFVTSAYAVEDGAASGARAAMRLSPALLPPHRFGGSVGFLIRSPGPNYPHPAAYFKLELGAGALRIQQGSQGDDSSEPRLPRKAPRSEEALPRPISWR